MFILKKKLFKECKKSSITVKIRITTLELIDEMAEESGLSRQEIMDRAIKYAYEDLEWEE